MKPLETSVLPPGIRSRFVDEINGLTVHILYAASVMLLVRRIARAS